MALPVNKKTLDKNIEDNILLNNNSQFITAQRLQNTLYPIVNSTYGLKTIWAGQVRVNAGWARTNHPEDRTWWYIIENYCDPNYFASDNPSNIADPLNKYIVTNAGSSLLADNGTPNGVITNKSVTNLQAGIGGYGLTFNGTITAGVLSSLSVNNPGAGYQYGVENYPAPNNPPIYTSRMRLNVTNSGNPPEIKFNLTNTISIAWDDTQFYQNGWVHNQFNVFIPNKTTTIGPSEVIVLNWTDAMSFNAPLLKSLSRVSAAVNDQTSGDLRPGFPGFVMAVNCQNDGLSGTDKIATGYLEIKVPIINTTI